MYAKKASLIALLCLGIPWLSATTAFADDAGTVSLPGVFTYQAPAGWEVTKSAVSPYPVALAAVENNFRVNINVQTEAEATPLSLDDYVAAGVKNLEATPQISNFKIAEQKPFQTASGISGVRLVATDDVSTYHLQQCFYFFSTKGNSKLVVTCTCLAGDGARFAPIFDAALRTFTEP